MPRPRVLPAALLLLALAVSDASGQDLSAAVFAPFVSRLKAVVSGSQIKLTWKDSSDVRGENFVYRSRAEITEMNIGSAGLIARVPTGVEYYVDTPPDENGYYYAVLIEDAEKKLYKVIIPFRNVTSVAVAVQTTASEEQLASRITGIKATVSAGQDAIDLSFNSSNLSRDLIVFWSTSPLLTAEDLLRGTSKTSIEPGVLTYRVPGIPGLDYYFAVLDAGLFKVGKTPLDPGVNSTVESVQIPLTAIAGGEVTAPERRTLPLPALQLAQAIESGRGLPSDRPFTLPEPKSVSAATTAAIHGIMAGIARPSARELQPVVLESDQTPAVGGELASLQSIVSRLLSKKNFSEAGKLLEDFLSLPRSPEMEARVRFYLGEAYYFQDKPREAVMEFLLAEDYLFHETRPWLDACFSKLETAN